MNTDKNSFCRQPGSELASR